MSIERLKKWIIVKWLYWVFSNPRLLDIIVCGEDVSTSTEISVSYCYPSN
jgi:hypothetical protein